MKNANSSSSGLVVISWCTRRVSLGSQLGQWGVKTPNPFYMDFKFLPWFPGAHSCCSKSCFCLLCWQQGRSELFLWFEAHLLWVSPVQFSIFNPSCTLLFTSSEIAATAAPFWSPSHKPQSHLSFHTDPKSCLHCSRWSFHPGKNPSLRFTSQASGSAFGCQLPKPSDSSAWVATGGGRVRTEGIFIVFIVALQCHALGYPESDQLQGLTGNTKLRCQEHRFLLFLSEFPPGFDSGKPRKRRLQFPSSLH